MRELVPSTPKPQNRIVPLTNTVHTLVVDANYLMKQSYEATQNNPDFIYQGSHYGGLYMFFTKLRQLVREFAITKVMLMWDGENGGQLRHDIYPDYKENRPGKKFHGSKEYTPAQVAEMNRTKESIAAQRKRVQTYAEELYLRQVEIDIIEGDDLIAYYCKRYHEQEKITIYSNDADMLALVAYDNVNVYLAGKKKSFNKSNYYLHFPYHYTNACLMKTICGCKSDFIFGIVGMGETTLLNNFPDLKERTYSYQELIVEAARINDTRQAGKGKAKLKRLKVLDDLVNGVSLRWNPRTGEREPKEVGLEFFEINEQIVDLLNPMLRPEDIEEIELTAESPLSTHDRGGKNLLKLMNADGFLTTFGNNYVSYVDPFVPLVLREKKYAES
jgi:5'-3' exonuclease